MPTPIDLSLSSLVPTLSPIPDELTNLASSLLAQSRSKASALKPEEEIGRTYACCHIACQRLGHKLALEIGKPAPPVGPRVYAKLHSVLTTTTGTPKRAVRGAGETPGSRGKEGVSPAAGRSLGRQATTPGSRKRKAEAVEETPSKSARTTRKADATSEPPVEGDAEILEDELEDADDQDTPVAVARPAKTPLRRGEKHGATDEDDPGPAGLLPGLGTMFQPAVDWLSDDRRAEFARWKKGILREVALVEGKA
ncbi:uncharacterized protein LTR77_008466 [Saxophila tyrrhenica]|uniref:ORC6 first cyclin-like domain-containing protein n=1 Tax=Saxophila tyrrhenica TaxID=1690608 RepID=A0AAV9P1H5_9PEZI|nr:hypothetical protein LTR77_008466 [Saxophila tyrrhenica]